MATRSIDIYWVPPEDATGTSQYEIQADKTIPGTFDVVTTVTPTSPYTPVTTTLASDITDTDTTIVLTDGTSFLENDYVKIGTEVIKLGTKSTNTFTGCIRGVIADSHSTGDTVSRASESYSEASVDFGSRHLIRYRVIHIDSDGNRSTAAEAIAFLLPLPPNNLFTTLYGVLESQGSAVSGVTVTLSETDTDNYLSSGEIVYKVTATTTTDSDGFFYFYIPRDKYLLPSGGDPFIVTIASGTTAEWSKTIAAIPDENFVNFVNAS